MHQWWRSRHITSSTPALEGYADDRLLDSDCWMEWRRHSVIENSDDLPETGRHLGRKPLMSYGLRAPIGATHLMLKRDLFPPLHIHSMH